MLNILTVFCIVFILAISLRETRVLKWRIEGQNNNSRGGI